MLSNNPVIVVYHHLSAERDPLVSQLGVATDPDIFLQHMRYFAKNFDLVSADELIEGRLPRRPLLITFDDCYRSVLDVGAPVLRMLNAPGILFLNPGVVKQDTLPIDNLLSLAAEQIGLPALLAHFGIDSSRSVVTSDLIWRYITRLVPSQIDDIKTGLLHSLGTTLAEIRKGSNLFLNTADIGFLAQYRIDIGNHSRSHTFFRSLSVDELIREIGDARADLQSLSGQPVKCLSVPYGSEADLTDTALKIARESGHRAIFLVQGRSNRFRRSPDIYFRLSLQNARKEYLAMGVNVIPTLRNVGHWLHNIAWRQPRSTRHHV